MSHSGDLTGDLTGCTTMPPLDCECLQSLCNGDNNAQRQQWLMLAHYINISSHGRCLFAANRCAQAPKAVATLQSTQQHASSHIHCNFAGRKRKDMQNQTYMGISEHFNTVAAAVASSLCGSI